MAFVEKIKDWAARTMIRTKRIKEVRYTQDEINELIGQNLPHEESFEVPGGNAKLVVLEVKVEVGKDNDEGLSIHLICSIEIRSMSVQMYRANLNAVLKAMPYYHKQDKSIRLNKASIDTVQFINDEYLLIKSTNDIIKALTPNILKGIVNVTLGSALGALGDRATPQVKEYLSIFVGSNKQKVLDFHRPQIERMVIDLIESPEICYALEETDFEEKLFADLGQKVDVEAHNLVFKF